MQDRRPAPEQVEGALLKRAEVAFSPSAGAALTRVEGRTTMDFRPLNDTERRSLLTALRSNAQDNRAILLDRRTTRFAGTAEDVTEDEVITAVKSVPCHY